MQEAQRLSVTEATPTGFDSGLNIRFATIIEEEEEDRSEVKKVIAADWGTKLTQFHAALEI